MTISIKRGKLRCMETLSLKEIKKAAKEFGFATKEEFISQAIKEKILELRKMKFFEISERIRKGLLKRGVKPEKLLRELKS
ncbi:hypothetical protein KJ636_03920 [Patescibacteria group bacterium]|nr:hypothetical protein [Patescibacteria group bacterium]